MSDAGRASRLVLVRAVAAGTMDRAIDVAATLETRGYGTGGRAPALRRPWSRHDLAFGASAVALFVLAVVGHRLAPFDAYPRIVGAGRRRRPADLRARRRRDAAAVRGPARMLTLDRVTYTYAGRAPSRRCATCRCTSSRASSSSLAGGTGSGKSTLLRAASGLVPHFHGGTFAGRCVVGGLDTREHGPADLSRVAGTLFQDPETQVVLGTVRAELAFPLENAGLSGAAVARGVEEAALALGIAELLDRSTSELSGGELQRVALGAALATRPALVLLDEPTSQLDPVAGDELLGVLRRLNEEWGTTVVLAEHRLERCLAAADRVIAMHDGAVAFDGAPRDFLALVARPPRAPASSPSPASRHRPSPSRTPAATLGTVPSSAVFGTIPALRGQSPARREG